MMGLNRFLCILICSGFVLSCKHDALPVEGKAKGFPEKVGNIIVNRCAISGCHTNQSKEAASGLSLVSWNKLFEGTRNGAAVIPYNHKQSTLFLFCNTFTELGQTLKPTMPFNATPLSKDEVVLLRDWIDQGAPDLNGKIAFSGNPGRKKYYVCNQGCDLVTVFDQQTHLPMRCFEVGAQPGLPESPHQLRVSPDGKNFYILFLTGNVFQKFNAEDDTFEGQVVIGNGSWNTFVLTSDSKYAFLVDYNSADPPFSGQGRVFYIDLTTMTILKKYQGQGLFNYPHAVALNKTEDILYLFGQQNSNYYKVDMRTSLGLSPMDPEFSTALTLNNSPTNALLMTHDAVFTPDGSKFVITCQNTNELRIYNAADDMLQYTVPVGIFPQEVFLSSRYPYAFVSCMEDTLSFPGNRGCVAVVNYQTGTLVKKIYTGWQPHGMAVDDDHGYLVVANRNTSTGGPAPHHTTDCGGRNGYLTYISLSSLELIEGMKTEVAADPYFVSIRN